MKAKGYVSANAKLPRMGLRWLKAEETLKQEESAFHVFQRYSLAPRRSASSKGAVESAAATLQYQELRNPRARSLDFRRCWSGRLRPVRSEPHTTASSFTRTTLAVRSSSRKGCPSAAPAFVLSSRPQ